MTTAIEGRISDSLQVLIDARLDTIDRMLLGRVPRADRVGIVREVESQIEELMSEHDRSALTREDVLEILGRLDPPEAYLADEFEPASPRAVSPSPFSGGNRVATNRSAGQGYAKVGGILGICSLGGLIVLGVVVYLIAMLMENEFVLIAGGGLLLLAVIVLSVMSFVLSIKGRHEGAWAWVGGITSCVAGFLCSLLLLMTVFLILGG